MAFELLKSEVIHPGRAFTIRRDTMRMPDGRESRFDIVDHVGSVVIVPVDKQGRLMFVRQFRPAAGLELLELPAGTLDKDEAPEVCARREVREETGMGAGKLVHLGEFFLAPGYSSEYMHVYLATELYPAPLEADADEFLTVETIPARTALEMAKGGEILDAKSLAAIFMAQAYLIDS